MVVRTNGRDQTDMIKCLLCVDIEALFMDTLPRLKPVWEAATTNLDKNFERNAAAVKRNRND